MNDFETLEKTEDPGVRIAIRGEDYVEYQSIVGERWIIRGTCIACGQCEVGAANGNDYQIWTGIPIGEPGACLDSRYGQRLDVPVRPEISLKNSSCKLSGEYLDAN